MKRKIRGIEKVWVCKRKVKKFELSGEAMTTNEKVKAIERKKGAVKGSESVSEKKLGKYGKEKMGE